MEKFPELTCRKCDVKNPFIYFAPVTYEGIGTCVCLECARENRWLNKDGELRRDVEL